MDKEYLQHVSAIRPWKAMVDILIQWFLIIAPVVFLTMHWNIVLYILAIIWIGAKQHSLAVLMHEGAHYHLSKNRFLNNLISEFFLAYPLLISTFQYRKTHFTHHVGYHSDHHYYPSVPYYNLPQLHQYLKDNHYDLYVSHSYWQVLKDCLKNKPLSE